MNNINYFQKEFSYIKSDEYKNDYKVLVDLLPDYFFKVAASSTGKYHNKTQCETYGQLWHIYMFSSILNHRLNLKGNKERFKSTTQRDCMRCVPAFHDAIKYGLDGENAKYTVFEHPMLAHDWVLNTKVKHDIDAKYKKVIADMCAAHSGQWTTSNKSKTVLPEPSNAMEVVIHECDYLSSRVDIDMTIPKYLNDIFVDESVKFDPDYVLSFGKYSGRKLVDVYKKHPDYVDWMEENIYRKDVLNQIKVMKESLKKNED